MDVNPSRAGICLCLRKASKRDCSVVKICDDHDDCRNDDGDSAAEPVAEEVAGSVAVALVSHLGDHAEHSDRKQPGEREEDLRREHSASSMTLRCKRDARDDEGTYEDHRQ